MPVVNQHPSWCDRRRCTAGDDGYHWSRPAVLDPDPGTRLGVTVQIGQGVPVPGQPDGGALVVDVTARVPAFDGTDRAEAYTLILSGRRAVALGRMLVSAGRAGRGGSLSGHG